MTRRWRTVLMICAAAWLTACGGGGDDPGTSGAAAVVQYTIGGTIKGLTGSGLVLVNNGTDPVSIATDGSFAFVTPLVPGDSYNVTVSAQPTAPNETCTVNNGTGTVTSGNIQNLSLSCIAKTSATDRIGGTVEGLLGSGLILQNSTGDVLNVSANGSFVFPTALAAGVPYAVSVLSPPISPYQDCAIANGAGTTGAQDVLNVAITCKTNPNPTHTIGGSVSGLVAGTTITLLDNGRDAVTISANGVFTFATPIPRGSTYSVTAAGAASQQSQACAISNAGGSVASASITNVSVVCTQNAYIAVTISGLPTGLGLQLQDNGADTLVVAKNGTYVFSGAVPVGSNYTVSISQQPPYLAGQACSVTNPRGTAPAGTSAVTVVCPTPVLAAIQVTPAAPSVAKGANPQLVATGVYSDNSTQTLTTQVTWTSSNAAIATISNAAGSTGLAHTVGTGATTITATSGGIAGNTTLTVTPATLTAIEVTPATTSVAKGVDPQFMATGIYSDNSTQTLTTQVTWTSSNVTTATISNVAGSNGLAHTVGEGAATITAASGAISGSTPLTVTAATLTSIQITPATKSIAKGVNPQFVATGIYSDNSAQTLTTQVTWASSNAAAAIISNLAGTQGLATSTGVGTTIISATIGTLTVDKTLAVTAATLVSIGVTPANPTLANGLTEQFAAVGVYSDNSTQVLTTQVMWSVTTTTPITTPATVVATISNNPGSQGSATASSVGVATVSATSGAIVGRTSLSVTPALLESIQIAPAAPSIPAGLTQQFTASGTYSDNSIRSLTTQVVWAATTTAPAGVGANYAATISNGTGSKGLATTTAAGTVRITATLGETIGTATLTVTPAVLESIQVTPAAASVAAGSTEQFTAAGTYSDQSTHDITAQVTWTATTTAPAGVPASYVATISTTAGSQGLATTAEPGTATIAASSGTIVGNATLTVTATLLQSIEVTPATPSIPNGTSQQFAATGHYLNDTTQDLTTQVTWAAPSLDPATGLLIVAISNSPGSQGLATAQIRETFSGPITVPVTATLGAVSGTTTVTVVAPIFEGYAVVPANEQVCVGQELQFMADAVYSDGSTVEQQAIWSSSSREVPINVETGDATVLGTTTATITAASTDFTVTTTVAGMTCDAPPDVAGSHR